MSKKYDNTFLSACEGAHRLFSLGAALNQLVLTHQKNLELINKLQILLDFYIYNAKKLVNKEGLIQPTGPSFTTHYSNNELLFSSGHALEFIAMSVTSDHLNEEWLQQLVGGISNLVLNIGLDDIEYSSFYHAINALIIYKNRTANQPTPIKAL